jgi:signal transduction histidine kinase
MARADLGEVVAEVIDDLETSIEACQARIVVSTLPTLHCDATQMRRVFQNIIANALKFRHAERTLSIDISARAVPVVSGVPGWEIRVADNGIGMEPEYSESIFTLFKRLHPRDSYEGTGIGLSIVRRIIERHRGTVSAIGVPGTGSTFIIALPQEPPAIESVH